MENEEKDERKRNRKRERKGMTMRTNILKDYRVTMKIVNMKYGIIN